MKSFIAVAAFTAVTMSLLITSPCLAQYDDPFTDGINEGAIGTGYDDPFTDDINERVLFAESFGMQCEIHTAIYMPLELVNLHCAASIKNCEFFEILDPVEYFDFGLEPIQK